MKQDRTCTWETKVFLFWGVGVVKNTTPFSRDRTQVSRTVGRTLYCLSYQGSLKVFLSSRIQRPYKGLKIPCEFAVGANHGQDTKWPNPTATSERTVHDCSLYPAPARGWADHLKPLLPADPPACPLPSSLKGPACPTQGASKGSCYLFSCPHAAV